MSARNAASIELPTPTTDGHSRLISVIKEILRHSQIAMTADVYVHVTTKQQREAVALVGDALELEAG